MSRTPPWLVASMPSSDFAHFGLQRYNARRCHGTDTPPRSAAQTGESPPPVLRPWPDRQPWL